MKKYQKWLIAYADGYGEIALLDKPRVCQVKCVNFFDYLSVAVKTTDFYI